MSRDESIETLKDFDSPRSGQLSATSSVSLPVGIGGMASRRFWFPYTQEVLVALWAGAAYYLGSIVGFALTLSSHAVSTLWPPNAVLLACLLLTPTRKWWFVLLGVFPVHVAVQLQSGVPPLMILCWFLSNTSEALIGAYCIRRLTRSELRFDNIWDAACFRHLRGLSRSFRQLVYRRGFRGACRMENRYLLAGLENAFHGQCTGRIGVGSADRSLGRQWCCLAAPCVAPALCRGMSIGSWTSDHLRPCLTGRALAEYCAGTGLFAAAVPPVGRSTFRSRRRQHLPSGSGAGIDLGSYSGTAVLSSAIRRRRMYCPYNSS